MKGITLCILLFLWGKPATVSKQQSLTDSASLRITFLPYFGNQPLKLKDQSYTDKQGDRLSIENFKYYISHLKLSGKNNLHYEESKSFHLLNADDSSSLTITLKNIPTGMYTGLQVMLGTDSLTNVSGALEGDLDPIKGMYWTWNSGYINTKIEGYSKSCKNTKGRFEFHLGGYLPPYATARELKLPLSTLFLKSAETGTLYIKADLALWFEQIQLSQTNSVLIPGQLASTLSNRLPGMFSQLVIP